MEREKDKSANAYPHGICQQTCDIVGSGAAQALTAIKDVSHTLEELPNIPHNVFEKLAIAESLLEKSAAISRFKKKTFAIRNINRTKHGNGVESDVTPVNLKELLQVVIDGTSIINPTCCPVLHPLPDEVSPVIAVDVFRVHDCLMVFLCNAVKHAAVNNDGNVEQIRLRVEVLPAAIVETGADNIHVNKHDGNSDSVFSGHTDQYMMADAGKARLTTYLRIICEDCGEGLSESQKSLVYLHAELNNTSLAIVRHHMLALHGKCGVGHRADGSRGSAFWISIPYIPVISAPSLSPEPDEVEAVESSDDSLSSELDHNHHHREFRRKVSEEVDQHRALRQCLSRVLPPPLSSTGSSKFESSPYFDTETADSFNTNKPFLVFERKSSLRSLRMAIGNLPSEQSSDATTPIAPWKPTNNNRLMSSSGSFNLLDGKTPTHSHPVQKSVTPAVGHSVAEVGSDADADISNDIFGVDSAGYGYDVNNVHASNKEGCTNRSTSPRAISSESSDTTLLPQVDSIDLNAGSRSGKFNSVAKNPSFYSSPAAGVGAATSVVATASRSESTSQVATPRVASYYKPSSSQPASRLLSRMGSLRHLSSDSTDFNGSLGSASGRSTMTTMPLYVRSTSNQDALGITTDLSKERSFKLEQQDTPADDLSDAANTPQILSDEPVQRKGSGGHHYDEESGKEECGCEEGNQAREMS